MRTLAAIAALAVAGLLTSCATTERADDCGYTWFRSGPPAQLVTVVIDPDVWHWPGVCRGFGGRGCTSVRQMADGEAWAEIRLRWAPGPWHPCSTLEHEYRHAAGLDHRETYQYVPTDHTRR